LIALQITPPSDAKVEAETALWPTLEIRDWPLKHHTPTKALKTHVRKKLESISLSISMWNSTDATPFKAHFITVPSQWQSMLSIGRPTDLEFSMDAKALKSITTFSWLELTLNHGDSRTVGVLDGESMALSDSKQETLVEFAKKQLSDLPNDQI